MDADEPARLAEAVAALGLRHVVVTSVDRDDLDDGGAAHFAACIEAIRAAAPATTIEVLTPDFRHKPGAIETVAARRSRRLQPQRRDGAAPLPRRSARARAIATRSTCWRASRQLRPGSFTKSGLMVGLGETPDEVRAVLRDLRGADVDFVTIGQYLRPTPQHAEVARYAAPAEFEALRRRGARSRASCWSPSSPLTRSSYHADEDFERLRAARAERGAERRA